MKRKQKRIFGFLGLSVVIVMTVIAATIPSPEALANSVTDTINVRVVGGVVNAKFKKPNENIVTTNNTIDFLFDYEKADSVRLALTYTDKDSGTVNLPNLAVYSNLNYGTGSKDGSFNIPEHGLSYGKYTLSLYATGSEETELLYDSVSVEYVPVIASAEQNEDDELVDLSIDEFTDEVKKIEVYVDGELIATVNEDNFDEIKKLDFGDRESGEYTIEIIAKGEDDETLYKPYPIIIHYEGVNVPSTDVPDTGFFLQNLNISKEDFLVTGIIVFFVIGIVAFGVVAKGSKRK